MALLTKNSRGISLLYVMAALLVTGFIGTGLIKMNGQGAIASATYNSSESARAAVNAGFTAALAKLETTDSTEKTAIEAMLTAWDTITTNAQIASIPDNQRYLSGGPGDITVTANSAALSSGQRYRCQIVGIDFSRMIANKEVDVYLKSEGLGKGNSRAEAMGSYRISGVKVDQSTVNSEMPSNAVHLGGGSGEIDAPVKIHGGIFTYAKGEFFSGPAKLSEIFGPLYVGEAGTSKLLFKNVVCKDISYFAGNAEFQDGNLAFYGGIGIDSNSQIDMLANSQYVADTLAAGSVGGFYSNGTVIMADQATNANKINLNNTGPVRLYNSGGYKHWKNNGGGIVSDTIFKLYTDKTHAPSKMNIVDSLHIPQPPTVICDIDYVKANCTVQTPDFAHNMTGQDMNNYCDSVAESEKFIDSNGVKWTVAKYKSTQNDAFTNMNDATTFTDHIIIIVDGNDMNLDMKMYNHQAVGTRGVRSSTTAGGLTFIYVKNGYKINGIGNSNSFRGFIYSESGEKNIYKSANGGEILGGIYQNNDNNGIFRLEGFDYLTVYYDTQVMAELSALGIFSSSNPTPVSTTQVVQIEGVALQTESVLSRSY